MSKTLYVFLHGLICLIDTGKRFRAILINMPGHREALGHFLTERTIPQGVSLTLNGVKSGSGQLDGNKHIIVTTSSLDQAALTRFRYADIYLPRPDEVLSFFTGDAAGVLTGNTGSASSTHYSGVHVFRYTLTSDFPDVSLTGGNFEFDCAGQTTLKNGDEIATIHVVNEPETTATDVHAVEEFARGAQIVNSDLRLQSPLPFPGTGAPQAIEGLLDEEFLPLGQREGAVLRLLDALRVNAQRGGIIVGTGRYCGTMAAVLR